MKVLLWSSAVPILVLSFQNYPSAAYEPPCLDKARTEKDINQCSNETITPLEDGIRDEFKRLFEKFKAYKHMQEYLQLTKDAWYGYHNYQCMLESAAVPLVDQRTKQVLPPDKAPMLKGLEKPPVEVSKIFSQCVFRTAREMYAALGKL